MKISRRDFSLYALTSGLVAKSADVALASEIGNVKIVNGFPGSSIDAFSRLSSEKLRNIYSSNLYVENKVGIGGQLAALTVKNSPPDGRTVLVTPMTVMGVYPHTYKKIGYDPISDFSPVCTAVTYNYALAVGNEVPTSVTNVNQLIDWFRKNKSRSSFGTGATGSTLHFTGMLLGKAAGIEINHVGYSNGQNMITDLAGSNLPAAIGAMGSLLPLHRSGHIRIIATSGKERSRFLPEVGTFVEAGFKDLAFDEWYGVFLPAGASEDKIIKLNQALKNMLEQPDVAESLSKHALDVSHSSPSYLANKMKEDSDFWREKVAALGFTNNS